MPDQAPDTLELEVFRAGDYGAKGNWSEEDLDRIAADYDPACHEAPVTFDHRQDGPAQGWVRSLRRVGTTLVACVHRLSPALRRLLARRAYRKRSVELYRRFGATGRCYLKALSFLGAAAPEVKGLADPVFDEEETEETLRFTEDVAPNDEARAGDAPNADEAANDARERLVAAGKWNPAWEDLGLADVFRALGDGDALEALVAVLQAGPPPVRFGESAIDSTGSHAHDALERFSGTPSSESVARHRRALTLQAARPDLDYREALLEAAR